MNFFRKWFHRASEIDRLNREVDFITRQKDEVESLLDRAEAREALLEKAVITERKAKDKFMLRYCDQVSVKNGLYGPFTKDAEPKKEPEPEVFSPEREEQIRWAANEMRSIDVDDPLTEPQELEVYIEAIKRDPDKYLPA